VLFFNLNERLNFPIRIIKWITSQGNIFSKFLSINAQYKMNCEIVNSILPYIQNQKVKILRKAKIILFWFIRISRAIQQALNHQNWSPKHLKIKFKTFDSALFHLNVLYKFSTPPNIFLILNQLFNGKSQFLSTIIQKLNVVKSQFPFYSSQLHLRKLSINLNKLRKMSLRCVLYLKNYVEIISYSD
jgi:hypothetical protein